MFLYKAITTKVAFQENSIEIDSGKSRAKLQVPCFAWMS